MQRGILFLLAPILLCSSGLFAQELTQTVRGVVVDAATKRPLAGAAVLLVDAERGVFTDSLGRYRLGEVPVGRYRLRASYVGYQTLVMPEVLVESGKEVVLNLALPAAAAELAEVVVRAPQPLRRSLSVYPLTVEETLRFPATFFDPARLSTALPGVAGDNDQANGLVVRGNSPNGVLWRLEGIDIVNPNHTPNAGTRTDRVTANGGGVNILSAQLLGTSNFFTGAFPAGYGNALGGILDMRLRPGNNEAREWTAQLGLIGLDVATEGPFQSGGRSSYLVNYRYSTIGLLSAMGLDLGDEEISFQDLSFHLVFPTAGGGEVTFFGLGGVSKNIFEAERDSSVWEVEKDGFDINFESRMGAVGGSWRQPVGMRGSWRTTVAASGLQSTRTGDRLGDDLEPVRVENDRNDQGKLSLHSFLEYRLGARANLRAGLVANRQSYDLLSVNVGDDTLAAGQGAGWLWQPYLEGDIDLTAQLRLRAGLHLAYFGFNESASAEPRLALEWRRPAGHQLSLAYGLHSQLQPPQLYFADLPGQPNRDLGFTRAHHFALGYEHRLSDATRLRAELFYQDLFNVPVARDPESLFSALNLLEGFVTESLANAGQGRNYGVELTWQRYLSGDYYYLLNATFYEAKYTAADGLERDARYNGQYIFNGTGGREWRWPQRDGTIEAVVGLNLSLSYWGGFRARPIDVAASRRAGTTVFVAGEGFTESLPDYFRTDLRLYYKRNKPRYSGTLALDIQNLTNAENIAYSYFDAFQGQVVEKLQLSLIPILSYRVEF